MGMRQKGEERKKFTGSEAPATPSGRGTTKARVRSGQKCNREEANVCAAGRSGAHCSEAGSQSRRATRKGKERPQEGQRRQGSQLRVSLGAVSSIGSLGPTGVPTNASLWAFEIHFQNDKKIGRLFTRVLVSPATPRLPPPGGSATQRHNWGPRGQAFSCSFLLQGLAGG